MAKTEMKKEIRKPYLWEATVAFFALIVIVLVSVVVFDGF
jgi:hypothetical protein